MTASPQVSFSPPEIRAVAALGSIFALRMLGLFMIVPVFAIAGQQYQGATPALLGLAIGVYGLSQSLLQIPVSLLADKWPRKPIIVAGLLLFALGGVVAALSTSIWGVIAGRALAGAGAVSAVVMALLADVTREENRTKAMAAMGMSIALSFIIAFGLGPFLLAQVGLSGLFWLTAVAGVLACGLLLLVPTPLRRLSQTRNWPQQLQRVLKMPDLNRLHVAIFVLHLLITAVFVLLPGQLVHVAHIPINHHGWLYLPLLLLGFVLAIPGIIVAEAKRKMRVIFLSGVGLILLSMLTLTGFSSVQIGLIAGMACFFIGFNLLEALLPSWVSKLAPVEAKATAMGVNATAQFLGAALGGILGGQLLAHVSSTTAWLMLASLAVIWLLLMLPIQSPPYLSSIAIGLQTIPDHDTLNQIQSITGIEEVVVLPAERVMYCKIDRQQLDEGGRQRMSSLLGQPVAFGA